MSSANPSDSGKDWQSKKSLVQCLDHLLTHSLDTDVTFLLGRNGENIKAHSFILKARSPVLCKLLSFIQRQQWTINLPKYSKQTINLFLRYIYTDTVNLTVPDAVNLVGVARQFKVSNLVDLCEEYLRENAVTKVQHTEVNTCDTEDRIGSVPSDVPSSSKQISVNDVSSALFASKAPLELKGNVDDRPKSDDSTSSVPDALRNLLKRQQLVESKSKSAENRVLLTLDGSVMTKSRRQTVEVSTAQNFNDMDKLKKIHTDMVQKLASWVYPGEGSKWEEFQNQMTLHLGHDKVYGVKDNSIYKICQCLMDRKVIGYGIYAKLREAFIDIDRVQAAEVIDKALAEMEPLRLEQRK